MWLKLSMGVGAVLVLTVVGWRIWVARSTQQASPQNSSGEAATMAQSSSLEDRIKELEFAVTDLIKQVRETKLPAGSAATTGNSNLDARLNNLEASVNDLKTRIIKLETTSPLTTTTTTSVSKSPSYIPLGWSGSSVATDWANISGQEFTIDPADYSGYSSMQLEVNLRIFQNGKAFARLGVKDDGTAVLSSEVSTTNTDYTWVSSIGFTLPGKKTYRLQLKSLTGYSTDVINARIKVNF